MSSSSEHYCNPAPAGMNAPLLVELRPMTLADMVPGHEYQAGMSILRVATLPMLGPSGDLSQVWDMPVWLPPEYREPTPTNAAMAFNYLDAVDAEAAKIFEQMRVLARRGPKPHEMAPRQRPKADQRTVLHR